MSNNSLLYLSRKAIEEVNLSMPEIINALDNMFGEKGEGRLKCRPNRESIPVKMPLFMLCRLISQILKLRE